MNVLAKGMALGAALATIASITVPMTVTAQSVTTSSTQVAALPVGSGAVTLPEVLVQPLNNRSPAFAPYTTGITTRPSSMHAIPYMHYAVPAGYDADMAMHPYTSGLGPCPEGALGSGCNRPTGRLIAPSHYER